MLEIEKVFERDIDLFVINKFINDNHFSDLFLDKIGIKGFSVEKCIHSFFDKNGESDITVILSNHDNHRIGLLIEDKINAIAMPNQYERYKTRGKKLVAAKEFDCFYCFIIAPQEYLKSNAEAQKYDYRVSYEEILNRIAGDRFGEELIQEALREKKKGYSVVEDKAVTLFWKEYYDLVENKFPMLNIRRNNGARGRDACWPLFLTPIKYIQIYHKSDRGFADLCFPGVSQKYYEIFDLIKEHLKEDMSLKKTGKSLSVRIVVPKVSFSDDFYEKIEEVTKCLEAVERLQDLTKVIDCETILKMKE